MQHLVVKACSLTVKDRQIDRWADSQPASQMDRKTNNPTEETDLSVSLIIGQVNHQQQLQVSLHLRQQRSRGCFTCPGTKLDISICCFHRLTKSTTDRTG